jgi:hypothetical protein
MKYYWETIADNLKKAGWSWGYVSALDPKGRTIWIADAHRDGKRFIVHADELLTAFLELERVAGGSLGFTNLQQLGTIVARLPQLSAINDCNFVSKRR